MGGGTDKAISSDLVLQVLAMPFIFAFIMQFPTKKVAWQVNALIASTLALMLMHLLPTFGLNGSAFLVTVDAGRSFDSLVMVLVWIGVFRSENTLRLKGPPVDHHSGAKCHAK